MKPQRMRSFWHPRSLFLTILLSSLFFASAIAAQSDPDAAESAPLIAASWSADEMGLARLSVA